MSVALISVFSVMIAVEVVLASRFVLALARCPAPSVDCGYAPRAVVVLSLRGADPYLESCLRGLLRQDYPDYSVRIVVDHETDPAWDVVHRVVREVDAPSVVATSLRSRRSTCSLKCSAIVEAMQDLSDSVEVVAFLDADTIPHPTWLRELTAPLAASDVGATTGNRWYVPRMLTPGSVVRRLWNSAAVVAMHATRIAWGGTLCIKRSALEATGLVHRWESAWGEDTLVYQALKQQGLRQVFVPSLIMINQESCSLREFCTWMPRQLLSVRLSHPGWRLTLIHGVAGAIVPAAGLAVLVGATASADRTAFLAALGGLIAFVAVRTMFFGICDLAVRRLARRRQEQLPPPRLRGLAAFPAAFAFVQLFYPCALLRAALMKHVVWRGVPYRIDGPSRIRRELHTPFRSAANADPLRSL